MTKDSARPVLWHGKPYYSLDSYCKNTYGEKLYKVTLNANLTCPNRDGTLDERGCIFCSGDGSGDFAAPLDAHAPSITESFYRGKQMLSGKRGALKYIAYFQAFTNTYGPVPYLESIFRQALSIPEAAGISIATRPDCLGMDVLCLLKSLKEDFPDKFIWLELGLQTIHEKTAEFIRRGYPLSCFEKAAAELNALDIPFVVHTILGLPGESREMIFDTMNYLNQKAIWGIKLQLLHVLDGTDLAAVYREGKYTPLSFDEYQCLIIACLGLLSPDIVIHRLTGDAPKKLLLAPEWSSSKRTFLNSLHRTMKENNAYQGMHYPEKE